MKKLRTEKQITKYIKNLFTVDVDIKIKKRVKGGFSAIGYTSKGKKYIKISNKVIDKYNQTELKVLLWHEIGHLVTHQYNYWGVYNETNASVWSIKQMNKRRCKNMLEVELNYWKEKKEDKSYRPTYYRKAAKYILSNYWKFK